MEEKILNGKCLYTPGGAAREYAAVGCNFYRGCPYQCTYCYNRKGLTAKVMGVDHAVLEDMFTKEKNRPKKYRDLTAEEYALTVFRHEVDKDLDYLRQTGIFFSFSTDPMCGDSAMLTAQASLYAVKEGIPVRILTKNAVWEDDVFTLFDSLPADQKELVSFGFTLTGRDEWEPNAPSNASRIDMMRRLKEHGFRTFASIEPVVDFDSSYQMIKSTLPFCDFYMIGLMSHFGDYYQQGNGTSYAANRFLRRIDQLMQVCGIKVYYKESVHKHCAETLQYLYHTSREYVFVPVEDVYSEAQPTNIIVRHIQALQAICNENAFLHSYVYFDNDPGKDDDQFLLYCFFRKFGDIEDFYPEACLLIQEAASQHDEESLRVMKRQLSTVESLATTIRLFLEGMGETTINVPDTQFDTQDLKPRLLILASEIEKVACKFVIDIESRLR